MLHECCRRNNKPMIGAFVSHKNGSIRGSGMVHYWVYHIKHIIHIPRSTATCTLNLTSQQKTPQEANFMCRLLSIIETVVAVFDHRRLCVLSY